MRLAVNVHAPGSSTSCQRAREARNAEPDWRSESLRIPRNDRARSERALHDLYEGLCGSCTRFKCHSLRQQHAAGPGLKEDRAGALLTSIDAVVEAARVDRVYALMRPYLEALT